MPRVSRAKAQAHHDQVLDTAAQVFRERGFDGVTVAELMAAVGLTHGGFYGHFASKEALMTQAFERAMEQNHLRWRELNEGQEEPERARRKYIASYLSKDHRDRPGGGCPMAALAGDVARNVEDSELRSVFAAAVQRWVERLTNLQPKGNGTKAKRRKQALLELSALIGAITLARATRNDTLSEEVLKGVRDQLLA